MFRNTVMAALAAFLATPLSAEITIEDAYARASTIRAGAAFLTILNPGGPDDRLVAASSDAAARVELHTHVEEDGVMRMVHVEEGFALPADGRIAMKRGGAHVMFMGLAAPWEQGGSVQLTLLFESGAEIKVEVTVDNERQPMGH